MKAISLPPRCPCPSSFDVAVILVQFSDWQTNVDARGSHCQIDGEDDHYTYQDFYRHLFSQDTYRSPGTNTHDQEDVFGSMRDYFEFQSHGIATVTGHVVNAENPDGTPSWIDLGNTIGSYPTLGGPSIHPDVYIDAINAAIDSSWDVEQDMHIVILAGSPDDASYHQWGGSGVHRDFGSYFNQSDFDASFHNHFNNNWFGVAGYFERKSGVFSHVGIFAHEAFHVMGWGIPNIFGVGITNSSHSDSGDWSAMGTGYRTGPLRKSASPGDMDAVARVMMEWADPTDVNGVSGNLMDEDIEYIQEDGDTSETLDFYRLDDPYSATEFIVENRQYTGFNAYLPQFWQSGTKGGLLIWSHTSSTETARTIRRADNDIDIDCATPTACSGGDRGDPFPGTSNNTEITPYTTPNTNNGSSFTGLAVNDISSSSTTMTADLWADFPPAPPQNLQISNAGQNGQNVILSWSANTEPDLDHYAIYRGYQDSKTAPINWLSSPSATTTNTTWTDPLVKINTSAPSFVHYRIAAVDDASPSNESDYSNSVSTRSFNVPKTSADPIPKEIALHTNYPNPFNPETQIKFELPEPAHVSLKIYNVLGEEVRTLVNGNLDGNFHTIRWDGKDDSGIEMPSGIYVYRIDVFRQNAAGAAFTQTRKMTLLR